VHKRDAPRLRKTIALLMKAGISIRDMQDLLKNIEWLAQTAIDLEKPDISVVQRKDLDNPKKDSKRKRKK